MLDKKHTWAIFLFEFKMSHKTGDNSQHQQHMWHRNYKRRAQRWFKGFLQRRQEPWRWQARLWPVIWRWQQPTERINRADPRITTQEVAEELNLDRSMVVWHLKPVGKMKKPAKWMPHELTANQKKHPFEVSSSLILHNGEPFLDWIVMCDEKWIIYDNCWQPAHCWTDKKLQSTSQSQTCTKKRWQSLFGGLLSVWSTTAFWILAKSLPLKSWKSAMQAAGTGQQKGPDSSLRQCLTTCLTTNTSKIEWIRLTKFCLICHIYLTSCQPTTTTSSILTTFCRENASTTSMRQKMLSKCLLIPKHGFLCYRNKLIFHWLLYVVVHWWLYSCCWL